jgi:hypothetical protein
MLRLKNNFSLPINILIDRTYNELIDPEFSIILKNLEVICVELIEIFLIKTTKNVQIIINIVPTVSRCSMVSSIGLCAYNCLSNYNFSYENIKFIIKNWTVRLNINVSKINHENGIMVTKQINDYERYRSALENILIRKTLLHCIHIILD